MFNGSDNSLLASSRAMDPYGYDSDDEDHQDAKSDSVLGNDEGSNSKVSQTGSQLDKKYGIGAKLLSKMGYVEGRGLGRDGSGIANPIQVKPRTNASVGLGVLSDKRSRKFETIDSSDEEQIPRPHNIVAFNKTTTESLTDNTESHERRNALKQRLSEIQVELDLQVSSELLRQVDSASLSEIEDLSAITRKLKDTQDDSATLEHRIKALELQVRTLTDEERQLSEIAEDLARGEDLTLLDKAAKVLSLADSSLVDKLLAQLLRQFSLASPSANEQLVELVEVLQYQMEAATSQLNRTQTELHNLLFHCYLSQWQCFEVDKEQVSRMIFMLLDFEPVMKFINCFEYVKEKFVYPKLLSALESWNIVETGEFPPRLWMFDFFVIVDQSYRTKFKDIVESKVAEYFGTWYHRHSPLISRPDLIFIQELLGERYYEVLSDKFLPQFIEQLWDKHFDPLMELEDWKTTFVDEGSIFYARTLLKYRYYFDTAVFNTLLKAVFNEYDKILYQWLLYAPEEDGRKAKHWFYSIMNEIFRDTVLLDPELAQVRATFAFLDSSTLEPIHDESFDLTKQLANLRPQKSGKGSSEEMAYTIHNIPIRKVSASFKSVVEDFCLDNGFLMEKLHGKYAQLPNGIHGDTLVPVFKVSRGNTIYKLAISKDILWVERGKGNFSPTYLYELR